MASPNTRALMPALRQLGMSGPEIGRVFSTFNAAAPEFQAASGLAPTQLTSE
jgi:sulfhydrogenase subunit delta